MFSRHEQRELVLILDIQSSVVKGALTLLSPSIPKIVFSHSILVPYRAHSTSSDLIKSTLAVIDECLKVVNSYVASHSQDGSIPTHIASVHYVLSSPWIVSEAKSISLSFDKETVITNDSLLKLIEREREQSTPGQSKELSIIEERIFDVRLNGYSLDNWSGRSTRQLDVSFVMSVAGTGMIKLFTEAVKHVARAKHVSFYSGMLLQYIGIRDVLPDRGTYTLIHIHGELTDVAVITHHACSFFGSYPYGVNTTLRCIAQAGNTDLHAADSLLSLYTSLQLDPTAEKQAAIVPGCGQDWSSRLVTLISNVQVKGTLPPHVLMSAGQHETFFVEAYKGIMPKSHIELMTLDHLKNHVEFGQHAERLRLTGLYSIAIHKIRAGA